MLAASCDARSPYSGPRVTRSLSCATSGGIASKPTPTSTSAIAMYTTTTESVRFSGVTMSMRLTSGDRRYARAHAATKMRMTSATCATASHPKVKTWIARYRIASTTSTWSS